MTRVEDAVILFFIPIIIVSVAVNFVNRNTCIVSVVLTNLAYGRPAYQSSTNQPFTTADKAVDGNADPNVYHGHCSHTDDSTPGSPNWLVVDLQDLYYVKFVVLTNGGNPACDVCRK